MKKLEINKNPLLKTDIDRIFGNQYEMMEKINEIIQIINLYVMPDDFEERKGGYVDGDEWEVIKKCLRYCRHRYDDHRNVGIHPALSQKDKAVFENLIENL